jgi:hypothetical protein
VWHVADCGHIGRQSKRAGINAGSSGNEHAGGHLAGRVDDSALQSTTMASALSRVSSCCRSRPTAGFNQRSREMTSISFDTPVTAAAL